MPCQAKLYITMFFPPEGGEKAGAAGTPPEGGKEEGGRGGEAGEAAGNGPYRRPAG